SPAVPVEIFKSLATLLRTPIGKNSLVTKANAAIETANIASQLPCGTGLGGMGVELSIEFQPYCRK
ncbi:hypothetical protein, partial [Stenotrophomonas maltophilia]|uniref:hypothetical protein n=1 Tax=Stenotrophomonas maltophilia TaxID=40324 RepID=UPI0034E2F2D4